MLVLEKHVGEEIVIGKGIVLKVLKCQGDTVSLGITAPPGVQVDCLDEPVRRAEDAVADEPPDPMSDLPFMCAWGRH
jgi:sRNA-binding carbon storage regulator CsrA